MILYHWRSQGIDLFIMAESEDAARQGLVANIQSWLWQNPARYSQMLDDVQGPPIMAANSGQVISVGQ